MCFGKTGAIKRFRSTGFVGLMLLSNLFPLMLFAQYTPLADGKDKFLGAATSYPYSRYLERYFNQVSPGNDGKWGTVEPSRDYYNWTNLDEIYAFAVDRSFPFKEHCLIWGQQQPGWIDALDSASQREEIEEWMQLVGTRYPGIAMVDVVNEPFHAVPSYKNALGGDGATGWDWVVTAFELARQYMPDSTLLILNEYNVLHSNTVTNNYLALIDTLKVRNLIDGIGIQGHYFEFRSHVGSSSSYVYDIPTIKSNFNRLIATGIPVYITEFDIDEEVDSIQVEQYSIYFPIFWDNPGVKGITLWGYIEGDVWSSHPNTYLLDYYGHERPALDWIRTYINTPQPPQPPELIYPVGNEDVPRDTILTWNSVTNAITYHLQIATSSTFLASKIIADTTIADTVFQPELLKANTVYYWRVNVTNENGTSEYSPTAAFVTGSEPSLIHKNEARLTGYRLAQNYPNPFNAATTIEYHLEQEGLVLLEIYDLLGNKVKTLLNRKMNAGRHIVSVHVSDLQSGIYFYKMSCGDFEQMRKMILIK